MADYYSQATVQPSLVLTEDEHAVLRFLQEDLPEIESPAGIHERVSLGSPKVGMLVQACKDMDIFHGEDKADFDLWGLSWENDAGARYFFSEENYPDAATVFFQWYLRRHPEVPAIQVSMSHTCSKMRPDGFGGAALFITKDKIEYFSTDDWLDSKLNGVAKDISADDVEDTVPLGDGAK
jgi:hypothetical protein